MNKTQERREKKTYSKKKQNERKKKPNNNKEAKCRQMQTDKINLPNLFEQMVGRRMCFMS